MIRRWLFTVPRPAGVDAYRARRAEPAEVGDAARGFVPAAAGLDATSDRLLLTAALASLTPPQRAVLVGSAAAAGMRRMRRRCSACRPVGATLRISYAMRRAELSRGGRGVNS